MPPALDLTGVAEAKWKQGYVGRSRTTPSRPNVANRAVVVIVAPVPPQRNAVVIFAYTRKKPVRAETAHISRAGKPEGPSRRGRRDVINIRVGKERIYCG